MAVGAVQNRILCGFASSCEERLVAEPGEYPALG